MRLTIVRKSRLTGWPRALMLAALIVAGAARTARRKIRT